MRPALLHVDMMLCPAAGPWVTTCICMQWCGTGAVALGPCSFGYHSSLDGPLLGAVCLLLTEFVYELWLRRAVTPKSPQEFATLVFGAGTGEVTPGTAAERGRRLVVNCLGLFGEPARFQLALLLLLALRALLPLLGSECFWRFRMHQVVRLFRHRELPPAGIHPIAALWLDFCEVARLYVMIWHRQPTP
jgi:hypothetical protein